MFYALLAGGAITVLLVVGVVVAVLGGRSPEKPTSSPSAASAAAESQPAAVAEALAEPQPAPSRQEAAPEAEKVSAVPPPAGELEALEQFDLAAAIDEARLAKMRRQVDRYSEYKLSIDSERYLPEAPQEYAITRETTTHYDHVRPRLPPDPTGRIRERVVVDASGSPVLNTVERGKSQRIRFERQDPQHIGMFVSEAASGAWTLRHPNGKLRAIGRYQQGERNGRFVCFDEAGSPVWEGHYAKGMLIYSRSIAEDTVSSHGEIAELYGHHNAITGIAFSADGRRLATADGSGAADPAPTVKIWDTATWSELAAIPVPPGNGRQVCLTADGAGVAVVSSNNHGVLYRTDPPAQVAAFELSGRGRLQSDNELVGVTMPTLATFSPDGSRFAAVTSVEWTDPDGKSHPVAGVRIWDMQSGSEVATIPGVEPNSRSNSGFSSARPTCIAFSPDGSQLLIGTEQSPIIVWDVEAGMRAGEIGFHRTAAIIFSRSDGRFFLRGTNGVVAEGKLGEPDVRVVLGYSSERAEITGWAWREQESALLEFTADKRHPVLQVHELPSGRLLQQHGDGQVAWAFHGLSPDAAVWAGRAGHRLSGDDESPLTIYTVDSGEQLGSVRSAEGTPTLAPGGRLAAFRRPEALEVVDVRFGQARMLRGHAAHVTAVSFSPDGRWLVSGAQDGSVLVWDLSTLGSPQTSPDNEPPTVVLTSAPQEALAGDAVLVEVGGTDPDGDEVRFEYRTAAEQPWRFNADGQIKLRATAGDSMVVELRAVDSSGNASAILTHQIAVDRNPWLEWREVGRFDLLDEGFSAPVATPGRQTLRQEYQKEGPYGRVLFSPDGTRLLAYAGENALMRNWRLDREEQSTAGTSQPLPTGEAAFSPDGQELCSGTSAGTLHFWKTSGRGLRSTREQHERDVHGIAYSPDGANIASVGEDQRVRIWSGSGELLQTFGPYAGEFRRVMFSPDGSMLACTPHDVVSGSLFLLDAGSGAELRVHGRDELSKHGGYGISDAAFSPDGSLLVGLDTVGGLLFCWTVSDGTLVRTIRYSNDIQGLDLDLNPDGDTAAVARRDGAIVLHRLSDGKLLQTLRGHVHEVTGIAFSSDGSRLASTSEDRTVRLWGTVSTSSAAPETNSPAAINATETAPPPSDSDGPATSDR